MKLAEKNQFVVRPNPDDELDLLNRQRLLDNVDAAQLAYDPLDPQTLKNWALALIRLAFMMPRERNRSKRAQWLQDAKSKLEEALKLNDKDCETLFQLGKVHHALLELDPTLDRITYGGAYMQLCNDAITYFKTVQEMAPHIYNCRPWLKEVEACLPKKRSKDSQFDLNEEEMEAFFAMCARIAKSLDDNEMGDDDNEIKDDDNETRDDDNELGDDDNEIEDDVNEIEDGDNESRDTRDDDNESRDTREFDIESWDDDDELGDDDNELGDDDNETRDDDNETRDDDNETRDDDDKLGVIITKWGMITMN